MSENSSDIGKQTELSKILIAENSKNNNGFMRFDYEGSSNLALCAINNNTKWLVCFVEDASIIDSAMESRIYELAISLII